MNKALLVNKEFHVKGTWFKPTEKIDSYKSVIYSKLLDTSSSSGDWWGMFIQKLNGYYYAIDFSQENRGDGFDVQTSDVIFKWKVNKQEDEKSSIEMVLNLIYHTNMEY